MKYNETSSNGLGDIKQTPNSRVNHMTFNCDLESVVVIGSAHYLTQRNIWVKFNENRLNGLGDMERTRNSRINPLTFTCGLESR